MRIEGRGGKKNEVVVEEEKEKEDKHEEGEEMEGLVECEQVVEEDRGKKEQKEEEKECEMKFCQRHRASVCQCEGSLTGNILQTGVGQFATEGQVEVLQFDQAGEHRQPRV